jgi:hypothetical protein
MKGSPSGSTIALAGAAIANSAVMKPIVVTASIAP